MPDGSDVFDGAVRKNKPIFGLVIGFVTNRLLHDSVIFRVLWVEETPGNFHVRRRIGRGIEPEDAEHLLRPINVFHAWDRHSPTAGVAQFLGFRKIGLAPPQNILRALALGNIAADRGQSETASTAFLGDKENVLPDGNGCAGLEMFEERFTFPTANLENDRQNLVNESMLVLLRDVL